MELSGFKLQSMMQLLVVRYGFRVLRIKGARQCRTEMERTRWLLDGMKGLGNLRLRRREFGGSRLGWTTLGDFQLEQAAGLQAASASGVQMRFQDPVQLFD